MSEDNNAVNSRLILVRHGQTLANKNHLLQGASDGPLTRQGQLEAERIGDCLRTFQIDHVVSSDLVRAIDTAMAIAVHHDIEVEVTPLVREWDCGVWDGRTAEEFLGFLAASGKPVSAFNPEGGETLAEVRQRACNFKAQLL